MAPPPNRAPSNKARCGAPQPNQPSMSRFLRPAVSPPLAHNPFLRAPRIWEYEAPPAGPRFGEGDDERAAAGSAGTSSAQVPPRTPPPAPDKEEVLKQLESLAVSFVRGDPNSGRFRRDFRNLSTLGSGSYGRVYRCQHRLDGSLYAVKECGAAITTPGKLREQLTEPQAMRAAGSHPCLVQYFGSWIENQRTYIQMELCGSSVAKLAKRGLRFSDAQLRRLHDDMTDALAHLHRRGLAHLDLKPENIFVGEELLLTHDGRVEGEGHFKLGDLGKAVLLADGAGDQEGGGSPSFNYDHGDARYLSPELLQDRADLDVRKADLFALGITLYELAKGTELPQGGEPYHALRKGKVPLLPHISQGLSARIRALMDQDPARRPLKKLGSD
jgi:wee1-like protein kinase